MKKAITKSDKKKKKELADEIARLEKDLDLRHQLELDTFRPKRIDFDPVSVSDAAIGVGAKNGLEDSKTSAVEDPTPTTPPKIKGTILENPEARPAADSAPGTPKLSRAQKRREKKSVEERERQKRIEVETEILVENSDWKKEDRELEVILKEMKLEVFDIPSDGHWYWEHT
jgi:OTU domain-containing protein 6